jgi:hypothetical protein
MECFALGLLNVLNDCRDAVRAPGTEDHLVASGCQMPSGSLSDAAAGTGD